MAYTLNIIPGTQKYVISELQSKFRDVTNITEGADTIKFDTDIYDVDEFRTLYSALHISAPNRLTRNLFRRPWRVGVVPAGVNPALAYIMCTLASIKSTDVVMDPFCGGGTIAVSAAVYFGPNKVLASDISGKAVDITLENFAAAGIKGKKYAVFRSDVTKLKIQKEYVDKIITNLPFGIRVSDHTLNEKLYTAFAKIAQHILKPDGKLVILTLEKKLLSEVFNANGFRQTEQFEVEVGGLRPSIFVYKRS